MIDKSLRRKWFITLRPVDDGWVKTHRQGYELTRDDFSFGKQVHGPFDTYTDLVSFSRLLFCDESILDERG